MRLKEGKKKRNFWQRPSLVQYIFKYNISTAHLSFCLWKSQNQQHQMKNGHFLKNRLKVHHTFHTIHLYYIFYIFLTWL